MSDALGLAMTVKLRRLMRKHGIEIGFEQLHLVPMVAATNGAQILEGIASSPTIDLQRMKIRPYAFGYPLPKYCRDVPVLYRHDQKQVAGRVEHIEYDDRGGLRVRAHVHHERARRCNAFSIACSPTSYTIKNPDSDDFHAVIESARLDEVSLTDCPANPQCLVRHRYDVCAQAQFYGNMLSLVSGLQRAVTLMQTGVRT